MYQKKSGFVSYCYITAGFDVIDWNRGFGPDPLQSNASTFVVVPFTGIYEITFSLSFSGTSESTICNALLLRNSVTPIPFSDVALPSVLNQETSFSKTVSVSLDTQETIELVIIPDPATGNSVIANLQFQYLGGS